MWSPPLLLQDLLQSCSRGCVFISSCNPRQRPIFDTYTRMRTACLLALLALLASASAAKMPTCEEDTAANCLGDDADMSPEGIEKVRRAWLKPQRVRYQCTCRAEAQNDSVSSS